MPRTTQTVAVGKRELSISNLEKVLYPATGFTKGDVLAYYLRVSEAILPHLKGRALTLKRYPNGVESKFFYEKRCPAHKPDWVPTIGMHSESSGEEIHYCTLAEPAALAWVANLASIELHVLLSKAPRLDRPTAVAFDFDPGPPAGRLEAARMALTVRALLEKMGLQCFAKTSGGKGMHLYLPLNSPVTFDQTKRFARSLAQLLERQRPGEVTSNMLKSQRTGRVFMDWSQNDSHKTTVCVYSLRAREHPAVSTPVTWAEVEKAVKKKDADLLHFEAPDVIKRLEKQGDLFEPVLKLKQKLPALAEA